MYVKKKLIQKLCDRELGIANRGIATNKCDVLERVNRLHTFYEVRFYKIASFYNFDGLSARNSTRVSYINFDTSGSIICSSNWCNDRIEFRNLAAKSHFNRASYVKIGHGWPVARFNWLPGLRKHIISTDGRGGLSLLNVETRTGFFLLVGGSAALTYDVHPRFGNIIMAGDYDGIVKSIDLRNSYKIDVIHSAKKEDGTPFEIEWLGINPQRHHEFCIAGSSEDIRLYDDRKATKPFHKMYTTVTPRALRLKYHGNPGHPWESYNPCPHNNLLQMSYNYNGTKLLSTCALDTIYLFDTSMHYPIGRYETQLRQASEGNATNKEYEIVKTVQFFGAKSEFVLATTRSRERRLASKMHGVSYGRATNICFWDSDTQKIVRRIATTESSWAIAIHPTVPVLATSIDCWGIQFWG